MIIIIDGYNVLKQVHHAANIPEQTKMQFIKQLGVYAKHKAHKIVLVFDGGFSAWPHKERIQGICVIHVGQQEIADEYIKRYVKSFKHQEMLLVSTDRGLGRAAHEFGVESLDAADFYDILQDVVRAIAPRCISKESKAVKMSDEELAELDILMQEIDNIETKIEDSIERKSTVKKNELSKVEKRVLQKIKKL